MAELTTQNPIPPALNVVQGIVECKSVYLGEGQPSTQKRGFPALLRGKACKHAPRLAKIAQYIAIFRLYSRRSSRRFRRGSTETR